MLFVLDKFMFKVMCAICFQSIASKFTHLWKLHCSILKFFLTEILIKIWDIWKKQQKWIWKRLYLHYLLYFLYYLPTRVYCEAVGLLLKAVQLFSNNKSETFTLVHALNLIICEISARWKRGKGAAGWEKLIWVFLCFSVFFCWPFKLREAWWGLKCVSLEYRAHRALCRPKLSICQPIPSVVCSHSSTFLRNYLW